MLKIEFSLCASNQLDERSMGYERGHIDISGNLGTTTSKNRTPDQSMMLVLSIVDILDGLRRLFADRKNKSYRFVGTDSSFELKFEMSPGNNVTIRERDNDIHTGNISNVIIEMLNAVSSFKKSHDMSAICTPAELNDFHSSHIELVNHYRNSQLGPPARPS